MKRWFLFTLMGGALLVSANMSAQDTGRGLAAETATASVSAPSAVSAIAADSALVAEATPQPDSAFVISLLTCSPGQEVYELYGHTAIRVRSAARGIDQVFNYGVFSFEQPHFIWRFVLGQCDYMVVPQDFCDFIAEYAQRGSSVTEQVLNLNSSEASALASDLYSNILPENREYRYNIFRNNCTTKARDIIEANIRGNVVYPVRPQRNSFRTILYEFTEGHPWAREGNDLLLGVTVDTAIVERDEMFSPIYMMHYADSAFIDAGRKALRPFVSERHELLAENAERQALAAGQLPQVPFTPAALAWSILAAGVLLALFELLHGRIIWPIDAVLLTLQSLAGVLLTFMSVASEHPGVASNWQIWVLNPLPLFFFYAIIKADIRRQGHVYHTIAAAWLLTFVALYFVVPQHFSQSILPVALLLLSRAIVHILVYRKS